MTASRLLGQKNNGGKHSREYSRLRVWRVRGSNWNLKSESEPPGRSTGSTVTAPWIQVQLQVDSEVRPLAPSRPGGRLGVLRLRLPLVYVQQHYGTRICELWTHIRVGFSSPHWHFIQVRLTYYLQPTSLRVLQLEPLSPFKFYSPTGSLRLSVSESSLPTPSPSPSRIHLRLGVSLRLPCGFATLFFVSGKLEGELRINLNSSSTSESND